MPYKKARGKGKGGKPEPAAESEESVTSDEEDDGDRADRLRNEAQIVKSVVVGSAAPQAYRIVEMDTEPRGDCWGIALNASQFGFNFFIDHTGMRDVPLKPSGMLPRQGQPWETVFGEDFAFFEGKVVRSSRPREPAPLPHITMSISLSGSLLQPYYPNQRRPWPYKGQLFNPRPHAV